MTQKQTPVAGQGTPTPEPAENEEPALQRERDLPSDGPDKIGEAMIRDLPQNPQLSEPKSQPDSSPRPS